MMRSIFALVKAETRGFSLRARGSYREAGNADDAVLLAEPVESLGRLLGEAHDATRTGALGRGH